MKDKGLEILAVNGFDSEGQIEKYLKDGKFTFKIVLGDGDPMFALGKTYGVQAYPTNYLITSDGKIAWRGVGFDEDKLRAALEKIGLK